MKWIEPRPVTPSDEITNTYGSRLILSEQLTRRGISAAAQAQAYLDPRTYPQSSPFAFNDMEKAVARIERAIREKQPIGVWGDFDVDGQTSTALLVKGLRDIGAQVSYHIPDAGQRIPRHSKEIFTGIHGPGYWPADHLRYRYIGIRVAWVRRRTGAGCHPQRPSYATGAAPPAYATINPKLLPENHPMSQLAGVGAAFQIIRALYEKKGMGDACTSFYDLVALGTIADLAELRMENRFYAQMGLQQMTDDLRPSLDALLTSADYRGTAISESLIGFTIGPRLNAVGRLDDANMNVEFLLSTDADHLAKTAGRLEELNTQRKLAMEDVYQSARHMIEQEPQLQNFSALVLAKSGWEKGVVGIAASRLVEDFNKPVILLNISDGQAAGSVRSVEGINIIQAITENARFLDSFGGHPMAAGLALKMDNLPAFRSALSQTIKRTYGRAPAEKELQIDTYLPLSNLNMDLVDEINSLAPFGNGNPPPVLVTRNLEIAQSVNLGRKDLHKKVSVQNQQGETQEVLWWNARDQRQPRGYFDLAYYLRLNEFRGETHITLEWIDWQEHEAEKIEVSFPLYTSQIEDYRFVPDPLEHARSYSKQPGVCFWGEGFTRKPEGFPIVHRGELERAAILDILTPPPNSAVLQEALKKVRPKKVILHGWKQTDDSFDGFLNKLAGMVKFALNHREGRFDLDASAAVLGQTPTLVLSGLRWLQVHGDILVTHEGQHEVFLQKTPAAQASGPVLLKEQAGIIQKTLNETAAFRSFYLRADAKVLLRKI